MSRDKDGYNYKRKIYIWLQVNEYHPHEILCVARIDTNLKAIWERLQKYYTGVEKELHNQEWMQINSYSTFTRQFQLVGRMSIKAKMIKGIGEKRYSIEQYTI